MKNFVRIKLSPKNERDYETNMSFNEDHAKEVYEQLKDHFERKSLTDGDIPV